MPSNVVKLLRASPACRPTGRPDQIARDYEHEPKRIGPHRQSNRRHLKDGGHATKASAILPSREPPNTLAYRLIGKFVSDAEAARERHRWETYAKKQIRKQRLFDRMKKKLGLA